MNTGAGEKYFWPSMGAALKASSTLVAHLATTECRLPCTMRFSSPLLATASFDHACAHSGQAYIAPSAQANSELHSGHSGNEGMASLFLIRQKIGA